MNSSTPVFQVPVEAHRNRATRRFALSRRRQRKGQALILAVLIMLMVAVLSAGFLVVVSGNLNQTARITDKTRAVESARSGLKFVNDQLTYSQLGENWRAGYPRVESRDTFPGYTLPLTQNEADKINQNRSANGCAIFPTSRDADYNLYYSSVDQANDWAGKFAKFPDPLAPRSDAPQYLARVQRIPGELDLGDSDLNPTSTATTKIASDAAKNGMLRITIIGLSNDDPAAFSKVVAYKGGTSSPFGRFARVVSNWDFANKIVPVAKADTYDATAKTLTLTDMQGNFPVAPFTVMVGNALSGNLSGGVVTGVSADRKTLTFAEALTGTVAKGSRVELAAQLGAPLGLTINASTNQSQLSYGNDGTFTNTSFDISNTTPGSAFVNGSALLMGDVNALNLNGQATQAKSNIQVSGLMLRNNTSRTVNVTGTPKNSNTAITGTLVTSSNTPNFPLNALDTEDFDSLVSDGANRINNDPSALRQTKPFPPPDISSSSGAGRYRQLTRDSPTTVTGQDSASNYGYGKGIYINNPSDRERVVDAVTSKLRDMTQPEMVKMWMSRTFDTTTRDVVEDTTDFCRTGTPAALNVATASLEQQHLRGWVAPDEFHARGALIELFNDANDNNIAKIAVTLDARSDNTTTATNSALGPVADKAWKKPTGAVEDGIYVYRKVFPWPTNGVIFAEGNVRVRGQVTSPAAPNDIKNSLTIVSQNNIYVDGSLGVTVPTGQPARKILLLARKNVVANPTQAIFRPDTQTVDTSTASVTLSPTTPQPVKVADVSDFQAGDVVETATTANPAVVKTVSVVQNVTPDNPVAVGTAPGTLPGTLNLVALQGTSIDSADVVRTRADDKQTTAAGITRPVIASSADAIQRRFQISTIANLRLAFYHNADAIKALSVGVEAVPTYITPSSVITLSHKKKDVTPPLTPPDHKVLIGTYTEPSSGTDKFPGATSPEPTLADNSVDAIINALKAKEHPSTPSIPGSVNWRYTAVADPGFTSYTAATPFHYLSALGNRLPYGPPPSGGTQATIWNGTASTPADIPMATSITPFLNGSAISLLGLDGNGASQFGFSPTAYVPATQAIEDDLTVDKSFYQGTTTAGIPSPDTNNVTLDSRALTGAAVGINPFVLRQNTGIVSNVLLPTYRSGNMKLESVNPAAFGSPGSGDITPGYTMNINAFVYAQTGSWFVIPAAPSDPMLQQVRGDAVSSYIDFNNNNIKDAGEYVTGTGASAGLEGADLNRNGVLDVGEAQAHVRYSRPNYQVNFTGAIAENQSALVNPAGTLPGAVQAWSNSWANYTVTAGAITTPRPGVFYTFDADYANNSLDPNDPGFVMPQSDQLTYVE